MIVAPYVGLGRHELGRLERPCRQTEPPGPPPRYGASASAHLQWGHRLSAMETPTPTDGSRRHLVASMGPTAFRRWKRSTGRVQRTTSAARFNGATAFRRWKRPVTRCPFAVHLRTTFAVYLLPLQWGHRLSAMETSSPALPVCCLVAAPSIGSPPFGDGNRSLWARLRHEFMTGGRWFRHRWAGLA